MPELTVIMSVYNCPSKQMLCRAIDSILNQTYRDYEFIICDDGSTNDTAKWILEKAETDKRIVLARNKRNCGLAAALDKCITRARGKFIARQDADDYSASARLQLQIEFLKNNRNIAFVGSDCFLYDENGVYSERHMPRYPSKEDFLFNSPFIHGTVMFRRDVFRRCGAYSLIGRCRKYEDYDLFMRVYAAGLQGANLDQLLYAFYSREKKNFVSLKMRVDEFQVRARGFQNLGLLPAGLPYVVKPLALIFVPNKPLNWLKERGKNGLLNLPALLLKTYKILVNRNSYIKLNYERFVNTNRRMHSRFPFISWLYLLRLNLESVLLKKTAWERETPRGLKGAESARYRSSLDVAESLCQRDVVSFDVFDTLLFRPFAVPSDLFYFVGEKLDYPDFRTIRRGAERQVRAQKGGEITLRDVYNFIASKTGTNAEEGEQAEMEVEYDLCSANPYMKRIWERVAECGKKIVVTSDMYLPSDFIRKLLEKNGFSGCAEIFLSCEEGCGKYDGRLYEVMKARLGTDSISHIGDNRRSDVQMARRRGLHAIEYRNVNLEGNRYRPREMSPVIGSAYGGIVNRLLYRGDRSYSPAYEYGYKYGGLLILGFCEFIHRMLLERQGDRLLFFSRDGYIVKKVYDMLYPASPTRYVYWSKDAAARLGAGLFRDNFVRRFITRKIGQGLYDVVDAIGIAGWDFPFSLNGTMTRRGAAMLEEFLLSHWDELLETYAPAHQAAKRYFSEVLRDCRHAITVDCGWSGSGNVILEQLVNRVWGMDCAFTGLLAAGNSALQRHADSGEMFLLNGKMSVYCFSSALNRDKFTSHNPDARHNRYFELLFSAPEPSFRSFQDSGEGGYQLLFQKSCENKLYIEEIQKGELDFIREYLSTFARYPFMRNISGSDAYAPFMDAMQSSRKYIDRIFSECVFEDAADKKKSMPR